MNSAHASLLQWLQERPSYIHLMQFTNPGWMIQVRDVSVIGSARTGYGPSYEAACYDLLQQLKR